MKQTLALLSIVIITAIMTAPAVFSDDDWYEYKRHSLGVDSVTSPLYKEECGSCHMAYPPGLLPATSWQAIMTGLEDHFGDNAELSTEHHKQISEFLVNHSADDSRYRRSRNIMKSLDNNQAPLRISDTAYFRHEHNEIPDRLVKNNEKVRSFSHCNACHSRAEQGLFDEHDINIPGYGRWDD